jgi:8-oxo-dGTP pyrophosphatase MutT (NUDIX family)
MQLELIRLLSRYAPNSIVEQGYLSRTLDFVRRTPACTSRHTPEGHITASAWVLSPDGNAALLTHHRKLGRWFQPGGHVEDDATIQEAALREAREESGIADLRLLSEAIFDVDVHLIPARKGEPEHWHYDVRFLIQAGTREFAVGQESLDLAWRDLDALVDVDESILRMVRKTRDLGLVAG